MCVCVWGEPFEKDVCVLEERLNAGIVIVQVFHRCSSCQVILKQLRTQRRDVSCSNRGEEIFTLFFRVVIS